MKIIEVNVRFNGAVKIHVPDHLSDADGKLLAGKIALARIIACTHNPDAPEEDAYDEYEEQCSAKAKETADFDWDDCIDGGVGGTWTLA